MPETPSVDLRTRYLGLDLTTPLVASAGPLTHTPDGVLALADAGVGAVVWHSVLEEQLHGPDGQQAAARHAASLGAAAASAGVPVIGSVNGTSAGEWLAVARRLADAGAAAIEVNTYGVPIDLGSSAVGIEDTHLEVLDQVQQHVDLPVSVKLSPYLAGVGGLVARLEAAGAAGVVLFSRLVVPDVDLSSMTLTPRATLSAPSDGALPRAWIGALSGEVGLSLAGSGGVDAAEDVVKYLLAGADAVMTTSALLRHGPAHAGVLLRGLGAWLTARGHAGVAEVRGAVGGDASREALRGGYAEAVIRANGGGTGPGRQFCDARL